jgi:hypothetical protein
MNNSDVVARGWRCGGAGGVSRIRLMEYVFGPRKLSIEKIKS